MLIYQPPYISHHASQKPFTCCTSRTSKTLERILHQRRSRMSFGTISDLACTYATLLLHDDGIPVTADKISAVVKAANVKVEAYWPSLFVKLVERKGVDDLIMKVGSGGGCAAAAPATASVTTMPSPAAEVTKKEETPVEESEEEDFALSLFD